MVKFKIIRIKLTIKKHKQGKRVVFELFNIGKWTENTLKENTLKIKNITKKHCYIACFIQCIIYTNITKEH